MPRPVPELGRLAPAEVAARRERLVDGQRLVARVAGVVGDDRVGRDRACAFRSQITRYGLIGVSSAVRRGSHSRRSRLACSLRISAWTSSPLRAVAELPLDLVDQLPQHQLARRRRPPDRSGSPCRCRAASMVTWTSFLPAGIGAEKPPRAKLQPMPKTRSDSHQEVGRGAGDGVAAGADRERMILGEGALGGHRRHDRRLDQLGQLAQLVPGLGPEHAVADVEHRPLRIEQQLRRLGHVGRVAGRAVAARRACSRTTASSISPAPTSRGSSSSTGPGLPLRSWREGAAHQLRDALGEVDAAGPLGDVAIDRAAGRTRAARRVGADRGRRG